MKHQSGYAKQFKLVNKWTTIVKIEKEDLKTQKMWELIFLYD